MVDALAKEVEQYGGILKGSSGLYFSHLSHSRTPSGCSAISFTSSILSEPLPEQKPDYHGKQSQVPAAADSVSSSPVFALFHPGNRKLCLIKVMFILSVSIKY